jgi:Uma2 family endonuclease
MATAALGQRLYTAEELWELCQTGASYELVKGELREMPPPGEEHGFRGMRLPGYFSHYVYENNLGEVSLAETGFYLQRNPDTVRAPDMAFIVRERVPEEFSPKWSEIIPDLVMEVVSPNDTEDAVEEKVQQWLGAGVRLVWVVSPKARTVRVYRSPDDSFVLAGADTLDGGDVAPGFSFPVSRIFA